MSSVYRCVFRKITPGSVSSDVASHTQNTTSCLFYGIWLTFIVDLVTFSQLHKLYSLEWWYDVWFLMMMAKEVKMSNIDLFYGTDICKGKAITVTGRGGPKDCEASRLPRSSRQAATDGGEVVILTRLPPCNPPPPGRFLVLISVRGWVDPRPIGRLEGLGQLNKSDELIGNRIRDLPACSTVPRPTTLPCNLTVQTYLVLLRFADIAVYFYKLVGCGNPVWSKSIGAMFPTACGHFVSVTFW
jgi:hypothetical protein